ncbi:MAG: Gfo/Idh/MocA family oxidoreductase [Candidatus Omnitrophica bacterium]|nr:Gfo/Idh/MocA family oxidoreductase [Candidatus Omnitrophota bacterium]
MEPIKVAVVGVGHLGSIHARIYSQLESAQLVAVCDLRPEQAKTLARQYHCKAVKDFQELIGQVDAVSVAVPTQEHFRIAQAFLAKGIHTLVEKPITNTVEQADQLLGISAKTGAILQVGHVERFNAAFRRVRDSLSNPRFIETHRLAAFQPRGTEVGVVLDLMIHDIDILLGLVKSPVKRVDAVGVRVLTSSEDIANARIAFQNGAVANLTASRISNKAMRKFRIFQADTYVSMDLLKQRVEIFRHLPGTKKGRIGRITHERLRIAPEEPLKAELAAFLEAIQHKRPPPVSGQEARDALDLALQITRLVHQNHP